MNRRAALRQAALALLDGLALNAATLPFVDVSTPTEEAPEGGFVDGRLDTRVSLVVTAAATDEDGVDEQLEEVESRFAEDPTLGGRCGGIEYAGYQLAADENGYAGSAVWTVHLTKEH